jgi:hypothetical protein
MYMQKDGDLTMYVEQWNDLCFVQVGRMASILNYFQLSPAKRIYLQSLGGVQMGASQNGIDFPSVPYNAWCIDRFLDMGTSHQFFKLIRACACMATSINKYLYNKDTIRSQSDLIKKKESGRISYTCQLPDSQYLRSIHIDVYKICTISRHVSHRE